MKMNKWEFVAFVILAILVWRSPDILKAIPPLIYTESPYPAVPNVIKILSQKGIKLDKEETKGLLEFYVESRKRWQASCLCGKSNDLD